MLLLSNCISLVSGFITDIINIVNIIFLMFIICIYVAVTILISDSYKYRTPHLIYSSYNHMLYIATKINIMLHPPFKL